MPIFPNLPDNWSSAEANIIYLTSDGRKISFSEKQMIIGQRYDRQSKHLQAIQKGEVSSRGRTGLVLSELTNFDVKSKILGKGGNYRFHAYYKDDVLHFSGKRTSH